MPTIADLARATERVFPTHARVDRYYPAAAAEEARGILGRCLDRGEGPALLIGAPGTGKSMLLQVLAGDIGKNRPVVCLTSAQLCTRRALLQSILFELGQPYRQRDEGDLRLALMDYLSSGDVRTTGMLLLVDEAQSLPVRLLEELRILGNVAYQGTPVVRLLLAGSQALEETFTEPEIEAFNQRIAARCYMSPLSHGDTAQMVRGHLAAAGVDPDKLFTADALDAVFRATDGIARLVNQVCDRALVLAAEHGDLQVTKRSVENAWADLQQLPTPWNLPDTPEIAGHEPEQEQVVEYGPLSEDDGEYELAESTVETSPVTARIHQPEADSESDAEELELELELELEASIEVGEAFETPVAESQEQPPAAIESVTSVVEPVTELVAMEPMQPVEPTPSVDDLFGDDFEEEVVINEFASLEQAIPARRPRVTSTSDADLGQMLSNVSLPVEQNSVLINQPAGVIDEAEPLEELELEAEKPFAGFSVVEVDGLDDGEHAVDPTELDEDTEEELFDQVTNLAEEADRAAQPSEHSLSTEDDILVIEDEMSLPIDTAAAHRADYRQLFKTLRYNN
ncbi:ExeA family protein [Aeoliella mucimassa]|uniref:AAA+ ATPase domain-containing protein n=1 Tax=Aeoliella mucimassa TaxID=2527972 RepID=A0A518AUA0_9BACT|nr:AAA family ATPase [Aeoliella mucimassa]QDU58308.1 hypothetical protein Pan181_45410 [Aeoliella mucimassa]